MAELDPRRLRVALLNHPDAIGIPGDLRTTLDDVVETYRGMRGEEPPALLAACPPCQGMSSAQSARGAEKDPDIGSLDQRNLLVQVIVKAVQEFSPRVLVVENVQAFLTRQVRHPATGVPISAASYLIEAISRDYRAYPLLADLADFGVPQSRKRCFLTFIREDEACLNVLNEALRVPYPKPSHATTRRREISLREALKSFDLPSLDAASRETATSTVPMHSVPVWPPDRYSMISAIPPGSGQSAWENDECLECGEITRDRAEVSCDSCGALLPRPFVRETDGTIRLITGFHTSYRRMDPNLPAATVTTASGHVGSDRTIHPWENRLLSPLECALLQTFPSSFDWGDSLSRWGATPVRAMIGEAVPPLFTRKHGRLLANLLNGAAPRGAMSASDRRLSMAQAALDRARDRGMSVSERTAG
jgi:DNA (cytosine-5)-methyltransferase 1